MKELVYHRQLLPAAEQNADKMAQLRRLAGHADKGGMRPLGGLPSVATVAATRFVQ